MRSIINGFINLLLYKTIGIPPEDEKEYQRKKSICETCPIKVGSYCSKKRARNVHDRMFLPTEYIVVPKKAKVLNGYLNVNGYLFKTGCGCHLKLKQLSDSDCPLKKW